MCHYAILLWHRSHGTNNNNNNNNDDDDDDDDDDDVLHFILYKI